MNHMRWQFLAWTHYPWSISGYRWSWVNRSLCNFFCPSMRTSKSFLVNCLSHSKTWWHLLQAHCCLDLPLVSKSSSSGWNNSSKRFCLWEHWSWRCHAWTHDLSEVWIAWKRIKSFEFDSHSSWVHVFYVLLKILKIGSYLSSTLGCSTWFILGTCGRSIRLWAYWSKHVAVKRYSCRTSSIL